MSLVTILLTPVIPADQVRLDENAVYFGFSDCYLALI